MSRWPLPLPHFPLEPHRTALVVVDMQNFCAHRDFGLGRRLVTSFPEAAAYYLGRLEIVIPNILRILECFRLHGWRVIFTTFGPELPGGDDLPWYRRRPPTGARAYNNFPRGTPEHRILDVLAPLNHEMVINKTTSSPFTSTGIDQALRHLGVECLVFTGAATDVCVESTARDAADRGYRCVIVEDACASLEEASHHASLLAFAKIFGKVMTTEEYIRELVGGDSARDPGTR